MLHWRHHTQMSMARSATTVRSKVNAGTPMHSSAMYMGKPSVQGPSRLCTVERGPPDHKCYPICMQSATQRSQVAGSTNQGAPNWLPFPATKPCRVDWLHGDKIAFVAPQMSTHQHAVSHTQRDQVAASINQGAPTDWCLLQLNHVECGCLHMDGSTVVARWTCLDRIEMGRPLSEWLPCVHTEECR